MNGIEFMDADVLSRRVVRAVVTEVAADGSVAVACEGEPGDTMCDVLETADDRVLALAAGDVVLVWRSGQSDDRPVILGRVGRRRAPASAPAAPPASPEAPEASVVPDELVIEARQNLTLKCGEGSITIRHDGKILIKGKDLVSHAQRMNRIKGGAVAIN